MHPCLSPHTVAGDPYMQIDGSKGVPRRAPRPLIAQVGQARTPILALTLPLPLTLSLTLTPDPDP